MLPKTVHQRPIDALDPMLQDHVLEALLPGAGAAFALCLLMFVLMVVA